MREWPEHVQQLVRLALAEDFGSGDITTNAIYSGNEHGTARLVARQDGVAAGLDLSEYILGQVSGDTEFTGLIQDGDSVTAGSEMARIQGPIAPILSAERTLLNFLQRMCGIATQTAEYSNVLKPTGTRILDTRKTVPGHRYLDKLAVRIGGGTNHRMCLDDRFLIKENHIRMAGGMEHAITRCISFRDKHKLDARIEIEVTNLDELDLVIAVGNVDYVMFDNMSTETMKAAVKRVDNRFFTEASGNVTLERLQSIAETGVDFISSGALTHTVKAMDISLLLDIR